MIKPHTLFIQWGDMIFTPFFPIRIEVGWNLLCWSRTAWPSSGLPLVSVRKIQQLVEQKLMALKHLILTDFEWQLLRSCIWVRRRWGLNGNFVDADADADDVSFLAKPFEFDRSRACNHLCIYGMQRIATLYYAVVLIMSYVFLINVNLSMYI